MDPIPRAGPHGSPRRPHPCLAACEKGDEKSCTTLEILAEDALLPPAFHARLFAQVHSKCETHGGRRCFAEGVMDKQKAIEVFKLACGGGLDPACTAERKLDR